MTEPPPEAAGSETGRYFRPTFGATLTTLVAVAVLVSLGFWQLERLDWKRDLIDRLEALAALPPQPLPADLSDVTGLEFLPVKVEGRFLHDREMYFASRTKDKRVGLHVVTPFLLSDGRGLLVDRGWVAMDRRDPATRAEGQLEGLVEVTGQLRFGGWKGMDLFRPANDPAKRLYNWADLPVMLDQAGLERPVDQLYLQAGPAGPPAPAPVGRLSGVGLANNHLEYALTWFALAVILAVIYVIYHFRPATQKSNDK